MRISGKTINDYLESTGQKRAAKDDEYYVCVGSKLIPYEDYLKQLEALFDTLDKKEIKEG